MTDKPRWWWSKARQQAFEDQQAAEARERDARLSRIVAIPRAVSSAPYQDDSEERRRREARRREDDDRSASRGSDSFSTGMLSSVLDTSSYSTPSSSSSYC